MDTARVNINYRPLRICWAIGAGDVASFRKAVKLSYTMWGGRFNPIVIVDRVEEAKQLIETFRADMIIPIGQSAAVKTFPKIFPHLITPFFADDLFTGTTQEDARAQILDIQNALVHVGSTAEWKEIKKQGLRLYNWDVTDPLADVFLLQLGAYPDVSETHIDYKKIVILAAEATEHSIDPSGPIGAEIFDHPSVTYLSRHGLSRHHSVQSNWSYPGFYVGDSTNLDDLVSCWNIRATDTAIFFIDRNNLDRYKHVIPAWLKVTTESLANQKHDFRRQVAIWNQRDLTSVDESEDAAKLKGLLGGGEFIVCKVDMFSWNGLNLKAPMMTLGSTAQLGVVADNNGKPKLSFALGDKPFSGDPWFYSQHLVASVSFTGGLYGDNHHTLDLPYVPEINEFFARSMCFVFNRLRVEPGRVGLVINAPETDAFLIALPIADLFEQIFRLAGFSVRPSIAGLITRQLISQMGGLRGAAVFKIPGVRRLLKTFGPTDAFTAKAAIRLIGGKDPDNPSANFDHYKDLYIEPRQHGTALKAEHVFTYLVEKGLFRMGSQLTCLHCRMTIWIALDNLKQQVTCEMCGREFDATRQLVTSETRYRRSGVLGAERNAQGAVPVALTLQQLESTLDHGFHENTYITSLDLTPIDDAGLPKCEIDFAWVVNGRYPEPISIILGECKDRGRSLNSLDIGSTITSLDIDNLRAVAGALPSNRFNSFVLLAKLSPFTQQEIDASKRINDEYRHQAILLTARELEPWFIYERTKAEFDVKEHASTAEDLVRATSKMYFLESE